MMTKEKHNWVRPNEIIIYSMKDSDRTIDNVMRGDKQWKTKKKFI